MKQLAQLVMILFVVALPVHIIFALGDESPRTTAEGSDQSMARMLYHRASPSSIPCA